MIELTKYQHCVREQKQYVIEAIGALQAQGEMDLRVLHGAFQGCAELTQDLVAYVKEYIEIPEIVMPHVNWDALAVDWLASEDSIAVQISEGIVIIERCDIDEDFLGCLEDLKADGVL